MCHKAHGEAAQRSKLNTVTQSYYDGILKAYTPAIDHAWQDRRTVAAAVPVALLGFEISACFRKVKNLTPPRNNITQSDVHHVVGTHGTPQQDASIQRAQANPPRGEFLRPTYP